MGKMTPYLVQRGKFGDRDYKQGIDSILLFDYMGSSEFEWGALPKSLGRIRDKIQLYGFIDTNINGKAITVFCSQDQKSEVDEYLERLANNCYLKEYSDFDNYVADKPIFKSKTDFWWDIDNDIMFWRKNNEFELKFKVKIQPDTNLDKLG